ncbi:hypothetical protein [Metaclostridioides mangenotii]|uniref:hypothetical protein n=1 Tax=Metaclostridioides mangenotii TaxID=1540 RepID=UPI0004B91368|nr:hypothetical protein [Clostridioides mangenotii]
MRMKNFIIQIDMKRKVVLSEKDTFTPIAKKNNILNSLEKYLLSKDDKLRGENIE